MAHDVPSLPVSDQRLQQVLSEILGLPVRSIRTTALGAGSRETPWRVDVETAVDTRTFLARFGKSCSPNEVAALSAMGPHPLPTPRVLHWEPHGESLGTPLFVSTLIDGEPLLDAMKASESWADVLYIDTVCSLQSITPKDLPPGSADRLEGSESALEVLEEGYEMFEKPNPLAEAAYRRLKESWPGPPGDRFSNGDLWPENLLVQGHRLVGIIDWQHAGFTDPIFEFLLPFFLVPELRGRGIEEAYCERMGFDPDVLDWYHGLEFFDSLRWVLRLKQPYEIHTAESLERDLERWLDEN
jgi:aminoglycoside phosphotransferase (APT) family kinase protein